MTATAIVTSMNVSDALFESIIGRFQIEMPYASRSTNPALRGVG